MSDGAPSVIEWRITNATKSSPIGLEATAFPRQHGVNIDVRAREVRHHTARGLAALRGGAQRPDYFSQKVMNNAKRLSERVTNGLALTEIEFGGGEPDFVLTPSVARTVAKNAEAVLRPPGMAVPRPYREQGEIEGYHGGVERDGNGRQVLWVRSRMTGEKIKCYLTKPASADFRHHEVGEILDGRRIRVGGVIRYKTPHIIDFVDVNYVSAMPGRAELPSLRDIIDRDFTGGVATEEYLEALRDGRHS